MSENTLIKAYRSILRFAGLEADDDGYISAVIGDAREPALVSGERLVLPLEDHLRSREPGKKIIFHPGAENVLRGESDVIKKLLTALNIRLNYTFGVIAQSLISLVGSPELHKRLTPDQCEILKVLNTVDDTALRNFISLMLAETKKDPSRVFVNIYLKRGGTCSGKRYARVGVVSFPVYKALMDEDEDGLSVKLRVKDKEMLRTLYNFIFDAEHAEDYCRGSDSHMAPYLEALLHTAMGLASRLNDILDTYGEFIDGAQDLIFDAGWADIFESLDELSSEIRKIPLQAGNEGSSRVTDQPAAQAAAAPSAALPLSPPPPPPAPVYAAPPPAYAGYPGAPQYPGYPGTPSWMPPPAPGMQPPQPTAPAVRSTEGGLNFEDMKRLSPALAYAPNALSHAGGGMMPTGQMGLPPPSWATPQQPPMGYGAPPWNPYGNPPQMGYPPYPGPGRV